jgi:hypothetical protein
MPAVGHKGIVSLRTTPVARLAMRTVYRFIRSYGRRETLSQRVQPLKAEKLPEKAGLARPG